MRRAPTRRQRRAPDPQLLLRGPGPSAPRAWKSALVTGASSGIGRAIATELARRGADLVLVARRTAALEELAADLRTRHGTATEIVTADLADPEQLAGAEARVVSDNQPVDLVVNNAGVGSGGRFHTLDLEAESRIVALNVTALQRLSHAALGAMVPRGRGGLLNVSSLAARFPLPGGATYAATKAFVSSFTQALHEEVRGTGVHVTVVEPGYVRTPMTAEGGLPDAVLMDPGPVARAAVDAVTRNHATCVPGLGYRVLAATASTLPRAVTCRAVAMAQLRG